jgi:V/A-type H+-transporting ATPase subunit I
MIVPMKKVTLVILDSEKKEALKGLARVGVLDIEASLGTNNQSEELEALKDRRTLIHTAMIHADGSSRNADREKAYKEEEAVALAGKICGLADRIRDLEEERHKLKGAMERIMPWGDFNPRDIESLAGRGTQVRLYELEPEQLKEIPPGVDYLVIGRDRHTARIACVLRGDTAPPDFPEFRLPEAGLAEMRRRMRELDEQGARLSAELAEYNEHKHGLGGALHRLEKKIEFEEARESMINDGQLAYISGFAPQPSLPDLKQAAKRHGWALLIEDPAPDDPVPTLVKNPRWIRIIKPVFDFLGTVPGYREYDISLWFLLFFSIFFGMLIGDAGYGMCFLLLTFIARLAARKAPPEFFILMCVMSIVTVVWGGITGTWFGSQAIAQSPLVSWMIIPQIYSFKQGDTSSILMQFCFIIGTVHLSIARLKSFARLLPKLKAFAELGWLCIILGMYFIVLFLILRQPFHPLIIYLLGGGMLLVIIFSEQQGRFIKGALIGLVKLPLNMLSVISTFADVVSYVRLFAVGLSALEIAKAFNGMAEGVGFQGFAMAGAVLILFMGHLLNVVLGIMAVVVHGVRLNMLEFSSHLGMEWTGKPYKPFKE